MKRSRISPISAKRRANLRREKVLADEMLGAYDGKCMSCKVRPATEKSHTRDRKRFAMVCRPCHSPNGIHRYLDDYKEVL